MGFWPITKKVVRDADIILLIADVRMPELSINDKLKGLIKYYGKSYVLVFNKIDLVSDKYLAFVKSKYRGAFFISGTRNLGISNLKRSLMIIAKREKIDEPKIGVVGYPNVGKSAIINVLTKRARAAVSSRAGTTKGIQWIRAGKLLIYDSPGVVPFGDSELDLGILGSKNADKLRDPEKVAFSIIKMLIDCDKKTLEDVYGSSDLGEDIDEILQAIGKKKGFLLKGGIIDEKRAAYQVIKDWQRGKLRI